MRISDWNSDVCSSDLYDGCVIGEDADNVGPSFDLAVKPFQWIRAGNLRPMFFCEGCVGEEVFARDIHHFGEFGRARSEELRVGTTCVCTCSSRWSPYYYNQNTTATFAPNNALR